jgi:type IV secretory pathway VirB6-like protein
MIIRYELIPILVVTAIAVIVNQTVYAVSQYDSDGFTIFPTKSFDYMNGYRDV